MNEHEVKKNIKVYITLTTILLIGLFIFQVTSGLFDSQSPESKILDELQN